jgi:hypothetical protein
VKIQADRLIRNLSDEEKAIMAKWHSDRMASSAVYREGYGAAPEAKNPYPYPEEIGRRLVLISSTPRALTDDEKVELVKVREEHEATDWNQWSIGHYRADMERDGLT